VRTEGRCVSSEETRKRLLSPLGCKSRSSTPIPVGASPYLAGRRVQLAQLAAFNRLPATYSNRDYVEVRGLMSYREGRNAFLHERRFTLRQCFLCIAKEPDVYGLLRASLAPLVGSWLQVGLIAAIFQSLHLRSSLCSQPRP